MQEISSLPDYWGNDYFDPILRRRDGRTEKFTGCCTDIFFREAIAWMRRQHEARKPFLCYLPLKAGRTEIEATFQDADGRHLCSAFFLTVRPID